jgi:hypothetical protein
VERMTIARKGCGEFLYMALKNTAEFSLNIWSLGGTYVE